jgi:co-chaperonin GroES (HSP10)
MSLSVAEYDLEVKKTDEKAVHAKLTAPGYKPPTKPLGDRILLTPIDKGPQEIGGIIIPDSSKSKDGPKEAYVAAIGSGVVLLDWGGGIIERKKKKLELKIGDRVFYNYHQSVKMDYPEDGKMVRYELIHEDQILGIFRKPTGSDLEVKSMWPNWWLHPRGNRVLIEWEEAADTFKVAGKELARAETEKGKHFTGIVLGFGDKCAADLVKHVKPGHRVFFDHWSTDLQYYQWVHDGKRYAIIRDYDIHCQVPARLAKHISVPMYSPAVNE